jgi:hypothetical protein
MEGIAYILFGLVLRLFVSIMLPQHIKMGNAIIGLSEGAVMQHILVVDKAGKSSRQYTAYTRFGLCLFVDYAFTKCWTTPVVVTLSAGVGILLHGFAHTLWQPPRSRCNLCQSKAKIQVPTSRRRESALNVKTATPMLRNEQDISPPNSARVRFVGAALLPDPIGDKPVYPHILSYTPSDSEASSVHLSPPLPPNQLHLTTTPDFGLGIPNSTFPSDTIGDALDNVDIPLDLDDAPSTRDLPRTPTPRTASPIEALTVSEDTLGSNVKHGEERIPTSVYEHTIAQRLIPEPLHAIDQINTAVLTSNKTSLETPDGWNDLVSEASPPSSVISVSGKEELISRAELIRQMGLEADRLCAQLKTSRNRAMKEGRIKDAFLMRYDIEDAENMSRRMHERAERRYYRGT